MSSRKCKLWIWQNRKAWTSQPRIAFLVTDIPAGAKQLSVYGWNGLHQSIELDGRSSIEVKKLIPGETYMFLAGPSASIR